MIYNETEKRIEELIKPSIEDMGYNIVRVKFSPGNQRRVLQIMAEDKETGKFTIDDCVKVNDRVSILLDTENLIEGEYNLEISSPGINRPLVKESDFEKFIGRKVKIMLLKPISNRKRLIGILKSFNHGELKLEDEANCEYEINLLNIKSANIEEI